jgi:hypothetical protein
MPTKHMARRMKMNDWDASSDLVKMIGKCYFGW